MPELPIQWQRVFDELRAERAKQDIRLDEMMELLADNNRALKDLRKMLRRRESQLKRSERENRKLRRKLGLPDPDDEPEPKPPGPSAPPPGSTTAGSGSSATPSDTPKKKRPRGIGRINARAWACPAPRRDHNGSFPGEFDGRSPRQRPRGPSERSISVRYWFPSVSKAHPPVPVTPLQDGSGFGLIFPGSWRPSGRQTQGRQDPERCRRAHDGAEHHGSLTGRTEHGINAEHLPQKQTPWRPS